MSDEFANEIKELSKKAPGRCSTCLHSISFDMPNQTRYWCRAIGVELEGTRRNKIRNCPKWRAFSPHPDRSHPINSNDPLLQQIVDTEDYLFWKCKKILERYGLCLKTILCLAHPTAKATDGDLDWVDSLDFRFMGAEQPEVTETLEELKALSYYSLAAMIDKAVRNA